MENSNFEKNTQKGLITFLIVIILLLVSGLGYYIYKDLKPSDNIENNEQEE
ncbi:MAG: hypothetical protein ACOXZS_03540 [Bacilli bacterium]|jgi:exopolysaccharide biosynthesis protein